jgi:hypothetical protein
MTKLIWLLLSFFLMAPSIASAKDASLSMIYTNALHDELPFAIFTKGDWRPDPKARFVKLHLYFDEPIMVKGLAVDTCGTKVDPNISIFFNFDQWILQLDPDLAGEIPRALYPQQSGSLLVFDGGFENAIEVRSLTFNFEHNSGFKVCGIRLKDPQGQTYNVKSPRLVGGTVAASSTLEPRTAYDPIYLFDSRFEYGWASNQQAKDVNLTFRFDQPTRIEKVRIWNGYQRSVTHCYANSRARKIRVTGDGGYASEISVRDVLGSQVVVLPKPFEGKELKFEIVDSFLGKTYKDLVISEVRFFDGKEWFLLDPTQPLKNSISVNRSRFAKAKVAALLNDSYSGEQEIKKEPYFITSSLRLRSDGSFYMSGSIGEAGNSQYFALGNYEIKDATEVKGIRLRLFGLYYETVVYGDCNGCGRDCNKNATPEGGTEQKIFQEIVTIKPTKDGKFEVVNESGGRKIRFDKLVYERQARKQ